MKARVQLIIFTSLCNMSLQAAWLRYDRGVAAARRGDLDRAQTLLTEELTGHPDNVELLYDAGVAAYKKKDYVTAHAYFSKVVKSMPSEQPLHRQALFNLGDAYAGDKKLHDALQAFEHLLALEPKNEHARHNRDVIKKMLEQQKNEESKKPDDKNEQKKDQQQDKKDSGQDSSGQKNSEQQKQDSKKDSPPGDQGSQGQKGSQNKDSQSSAGGQDKKQQQEQGGDGQAPDERNDHKDRYGNKKSGGPEEKDDAQKTGDKAGDQEGEQHKVDASDDVHGQAGSQEKNGRKKQKPVHAAWIDTMLDAVQKNDEALNKLLVRRAVAGNLGGREGERCW